MYKLMQFFSISMYWLWVYDYFLTLGDEVRSLCTLRPRCQVLTIVQIKYAWSGRRSWSQFISSLNYLIIYSHPTVFGLFIAVRHLEKHLKL